MQVLIYAWAGFLIGARKQIFTPFKTSYPIELGVMGIALVRSGHCRHLSGKVSRSAISDFLCWRQI